MAIIIDGFAFRFSFSAIQIDEGQPNIIVGGYSLKLCFECRPWRREMMMVNGLYGQWSKLTCLSLCVVIVCKRIHLKNYASSSS